jgi:hypothetical protein
MCVPRVQKERGFQEYKTRMGCPRTKNKKCVPRIQNQEWVVQE